jgi:hypothetical protein
MQTIAAAHFYASKMFRERMEQARREQSDDKLDAYELLACAAYPAYFIRGLVKQDPRQDSKNKCFPNQ